MGGGAAPAPSVVQSKSSSRRGRFKGESRLHRALDTRRELPGEHAGPGALLLVLVGLAHGASLTLVRRPHTLDRGADLGLPLVLDDLVRVGVGSRSGSGWGLGLGWGSGVGVRVVVRGRGKGCGQG